MTIGTNTARVAFNCNGASNSFPVPIQAYSAADFLAIITNTTGAPINGLAAGASVTLTLGSDYSMAPSGTLQPTAWTLQTAAGQQPSPYAAGLTLLVILNPQEVQQTQYQQGQAFPSLALQTNVDRLTQMAIRLTDQVTRSIRAPDGDTNPLLTLPAASARANLAPFFDANGNLQLGAIPTVVFTQAIFNALLAASTPYAITPDEVTAGAVIVNATYLPGQVDRYITNAIPGTTDCTLGFNTAFKVANLLGVEVGWGPQAPYRLNSPVNATLMRGIVVNDRSSANLSANVPSIIVAHNGNAFDMSGSVEFTWNNVVIQNLAANTPQAMWFTGRVAGGSCGLHRFNNCRTSFATKCGWVFYGIGSEENVFAGCTFYQNANNSGIINHNVLNLLGLTSSFQALSAGTSGTENHHTGFGYYQLGNSGTQSETIFTLEQTSNFSARDGTWGVAHGLAYINIVGNAAMTNLMLDSLRGEPLGTQGLHGVLVQNSAGIHTSWVFNNVNVNTSGYLLNFLLAQTPQIQNLRMIGSNSSSGFGLNAYTMSNSFIEFLGGNVVTGQAGGNVSGNTFAGWRAQVTLNGAIPAPANIYLDNNTGTASIDGDVFIAASAACTGAITTASSYTLRLSPNGKMVTLSLPSVLGVATAQTSFSFGTAIPAAYRPAASLRQPVIIEDNGGTPNQVGMVIVSNATGVISVFKDLLAAANFTAAPAAGLPALTEISWNL